MKKTLSPASGPVESHLTLPGSKSLTNRALLLAALANGVSELKDILISDDTEAFIAALRLLGIRIQLDTDTQQCIVMGCGGTFPVNEAWIDCRDAGTAARFLPAAVSATIGRWHFDGSPQLRKRPLGGLLKALRSQGIKIQSEDQEDSLPLTVFGQNGLPGGTLKVDATDSGQFVSSLLMAAPMSHTAVTLDLHDAVSKPFIDMTIRVMAEFGVRVRQLHPERFSIPVPQRYIARDYVIEPDLSTAAPFFRSRRSDRRGSYHSADQTQGIQPGRCPVSFSAAKNGL